MSMNKLRLRLVVLGGLLLVIVGGGWLWWRDALSAANPAATTSKIFIINSGESIRSIATRLKNEGLIRDQIGFFLRVKFSKLDGKLQAGDFRLSPAMDTPTIISELTHGTLDTWVTTLEGWRDEEIALTLAKELQIPESEFLKYSQEGYMFPDTYLLPKDASAAAIAQIFSKNFETRVDNQIRQGFTAQKLTLEQGVILASIVEREGRTAQDRPVIAGILLKRLRNGWPLQVDATIQYALGYQSDEKSWWKKALSDADKKINSPFNTYLNAGLPPTPIANPGVAALRAVAFPQDTPNWYYLHDTEGMAHYSKTLEEHEANVARYLQ